MPEIKTITELLDQVGSVMTFPDPLGELRVRGFTLAHDVQAKLDHAGHPPAQLDSAKRQQLAGRLGRVRSTAIGAADAGPKRHRCADPHCRPRVRAEPAPRPLRHRHRRPRLSPAPHRLDDLATTI
jgi:hypothetical protein